MDNSYLVDPFDDVSMDSELKIKLDALRDAFLRSKHAYLDALDHVPDTVLVEYLKSNEFSVPVSTN